MNSIRISVVVVEDEGRLARNIARHIEEENPAFCVSAIYSNGLDAWNAIREQPPRVVVTDISMPLMNGIELAENIHASRLPVRCVILTGYADFEYVREALRAEVEDYLLKPVNTEELRTLLKKLEIKILAENPDAIARMKEEACPPEEIVSLVKEYVRQHYAGEISLNTLSQSLGYSPSYLTKVFNKIEGCTPSAYLREYRMNIARQLLKNPAATVASVSAAVGYTDPFHFSKSFKQTFGYSPSEQRGTGDGSLSH